jgi:hypothetical protein
MRWLQSVLPERGEKKMNDKRFSSLAGWARGGVAAALVSAGLMAAAPVSAQTEIQW